MTTFAAILQSVIAANIPASIFAALDGPASSQVTINIHTSQTLQGIPVSKTIGSIVIPIGQWSGKFDAIFANSGNITFSFLNDSSLTNPANQVQTITGNSGNTGYAGL